MTTEDRMRRLGVPPLRVRLERAGVLSIAEAQCAAWGVTLEAIPKRRSRVAPAVRARCGFVLELANRGWSYTRIGRLLGRSRFAAAADANRERERRGLRWAPPSRLSRWSEGVRFGRALERRAVCDYLRRSGGAGEWLAEDIRVAKHAPRSRLG